MPVTESKLWDMMLQTQLGLWGALDSQLQEKHGLPGIWFHALLSLSEAPESRLKVQELANAVRHSQSGTTRLVDRLESEGFVERINCPNDRRAIHIKLTAQGNAALAEAQPLWNDFLKKHLTDALSSQDRENLYQLLNRLLKASTEELNACASACSETTETSVS